MCSTCPARQSRQKLWPHSCRITPSPVAAPKRQKRKPAAKKALPAPPPAVEDLPPLPGEDGYDALGTEQLRDADPPGSDTPSPAQVKALHTALGKAGYGTREDKLKFCADIAGRQLESSKDLTGDEVSRCLDALKAETPADDDAEIVDEEPAS